MGTSDLFTFSFFLNKFSHFYVSKNCGVKYIEIYIHEKCTQKSSVKKYFIFFEIQRRQIFDKKIDYCTIILLLFALRNLSFLYFPKYNIFLMRLFFAYTPPVYIYLYI
jgi:hypothetical protein